MYRNCNWLQQIDRKFLLNCIDEEPKYKQAYTSREILGKLPAYAEKLARIV